MNHIQQPLKREYISPKLTITSLDNSISLELQSEPPIGPGESIGLSAQAPEYFNNNPIHNA